MDARGVPAAGPYYRTPPASANPVAARPAAGRRRPATIRVNARGHSRPFAKAGRLEACIGSISRWRGICTRSECQPSPHVLVFAATRRGYGSAIIPSRRPLVVVLLLALPSAASASSFSLGVCTPSAADRPAAATVERVWNVRFDAPATATPRS